MSDSLRELRVLALDCQAGGATPAYGDLLELGWAVCGSSAALPQVRSHWIAPRTSRSISRAVRELTGWSPACLGAAISEQEAWARLRDESAPLAAASAHVPTVIHFARFELPFLRDLQTRLEPASEFPFDVVCLHAVAARLFPDLPRRNIRALAGYLGHSPELLRRAAGHVEATAFIWQALLPRLAELGVETWSALKAWVDDAPKSVRPSRRVYPLASERRRALPDRPGVYRFLRPNGDVLYVGKATSLKKRVASHFSGGARATERALEMLTQVHDIDATETASVLEAALLETDEIKRIDPPYNVQLRFLARSAWFAERTLFHAAPVPDGDHPVGPLPSERALSPLAALIALADGAEPTARLRAIALAVPTAALPDDALFLEGWSGFASERLAPHDGPGVRRVTRAAHALWLERGRQEPELASEPALDEAPPPLWDLARVRRRLDRNLVQCGLLMRRARWLCLLADADIAYREREMTSARALIVEAGQLSGRHDVEAVANVRALPPRRPLPLRARKACFDAPTYDRLRVLATELRRVQDEGGELCVRVGRHVLEGERLLRLTRAL